MALAADLEKRLVSYAPRSDAAAWPAVAGQCRCLVRRTAPGSGSILLGRLSTLWRIVVPHLADSPQAAIADLVTVAAINQMLAGIEATHTARTRANVHAACTALHAVASGLPHAARNTTDTASGPRTRDRGVSPRTGRHLAAVMAPRPQLVVCVELGLRYWSLRALEGRLPVADLAAHRDALRG